MQSNDQRLCMNCQGFTAVSAIATSAILSSNSFSDTKYTSATAPQDTSSIGSLTVTVLKPNTLINGTIQ